MELKTQFVLVQKVLGNLAQFFHEMHFLWTISHMQTFCTKISSSDSCVPQVPSHRNSRDTVVAPHPELLCSHGEVSCLHGPGEACGQVSRERSHAQTTR